MNKQLLADLIATGLSYAQAAPLAVIGRFKTLKDALAHKKAVDIENDPMAVFLAKGGKIETIEAGVRTSTDKQLYSASKGVGMRQENANDREDRILRDMGDTSWMSDEQFIAAKERAMIEG